MKVDFFIEYGDAKIEYNSLVTRIKEVWKSENKLVKDIENIEIYLKPEENMCYYVINEQQHGSFGV